MVSIMELMHRHGDAALALTLLVVLYSLPAIRALAVGGWATRNPHRDGLMYEDEDGVATKESMARFSNKAKFVTIFTIVVLALGLSITEAIITAVQQDFDIARSDVPLLEIVLLVPAWILLLVQLFVTSRVVEPVVRFKSAISRLQSCALIVAIASLALYADNGHDGASVSRLLTGAQLIAALALMATIFAVKRRPEVFRPDEKPVDQQRSGSLWSRYSFHWAMSTIKTAGKDQFDNADLPAMDHVVRSENATANFKRMVLNEKQLPLWAHILWKFRHPLLFQWSAILFSNFFDVAPAFATLQLLQFLESREDLNAIDPTAWKYVAGIVIATVSSRLVDSRIMWSAMADIVVPLRSTLTGLMYEKLMRMKASAHLPEEESSKENSSDEDDDAKKKDEDQTSSARSQQDIVNLFSVDCNAIATFGAQNGQYINCAGQVIIIIVFLFLLVGWQSLCAGMAGILVLFPINKTLADKYGQKQKILMKLRDKRAAVTTEALNGIRQIKFSAIETEWAEKIEQIRDAELSMLWKTRTNNLYMSVASEFTPIILTALSLSTYSYINGYLLPSVAFTAITLFMFLEGLVSHIPLLLVTAINAKVSCDRVEKFLRSPEKAENTHPGETVAFHNLSVTFPYDAEAALTEDRFTLRDLNLEFPNQGLSVISGATGSGKSLLLAAILGEVEVLAGYIQVPRAPLLDERFDSKATAADWIIPSAICFISQTPWIENATIKNNILFGLPFDPIRYQKVLEACALSQDLDIFEDGDETEVGAQGITLSGGQKWRLTLARALYSRAGIIVMDDVFSALDAHVGKYVFANALLGDLAEGRTRILVTHHASLCLPRADYAVLLSANGLVEHAGLVEELRRNGTLDQILEADDTAESKDTQKDELPKAADTPGIPSVNTATTTKAAPKKLVEDEKREIGRVKTSVYAGYLKASGGWPFWCFLALLYAVAEGFSLGRTYWIKIWTSAYGQAETKVPLMAYHYQPNMQTQFFGQQAFNSMNATSINTAPPIETEPRGLWFYLGIYCFISTISVLISISRLYCVYSGSLRASRRIFKNILHSVLRAPLRWLDTVPTGRILNRFTGDFTNLDSSLAQNFYYFAGVTWELAGIMVAALFVSPFMILCAVALLAACGVFARQYIAAARAVKRLESTNKSPVISHFASSISGLSTIRAFSKSSEFTARMFALIDEWAACTWHNSLFRNWLMIRIGITASMFAAAVGTFVITTPGIDASLAGFVLSFALNFGHAVNWAISVSTQTELDMNAAERIFEYRDLDIENDGGEDVRASWPEEGKVEVKELEVGYAEGLPSVLKGLTFTAERNQRIGVVGRTGAGKSTLSLALFRFLQTRKGSITIDGVDISKIKLHDLRTRLAIIPQDPVLFSGTIRTNLDPFDQFSDFDLRKALMRVHLIPSGANTPVLEESSGTSSVTATEQAGNSNIFLSLSSPISSGGSNLSQGQKQLLCLARAILSRPKVLLLDEATSAVDMATDRLIQRSIREEFANTTLLVIAHRLSTVADFDRILVMKDGVTLEFGSPEKLLQENGLFKEMVSHSGEKEEIEKLILGGKYQP